MEVEEYLKYRKDLIIEAQDEEEFISESSFLNCVLPSMLDAKLIDSEEFNEAYCIYQPERIKLNGYSINESGERLQLFIVNEESLRINIDDNELQISLKSYYETHFNRVVKFIQSAIKGTLNDDLQDADGIKVLTTQISSDDGLDQFDVIEIFLISATATVETRGATPQPKQISFDNEKIKVTFSKNRERVIKEVIIIKKLVDLNLLYNVLISQGNREPLTVDFVKSFDFKIEALKAAEETYFESYLCVLPGNIIADLYKEHSTRMLEKNVRSFLQFPKKGVNSGMKDTIMDNPEKFIAYNNGLTITSTGKEWSEENGKFYIKSLTDFQIVNGGQTTATIYFSQKEGISVEKVKVMAKINIAKDSTEEELNKLITEISTFSNAQSRVSKVDLRARSTQLVKIKALSDSVVTPKGLKWFFERAKGELNTAIRKQGNKERMLKKFPKERRFTKEELAKYYSSWGNKPYSIKLGGEKIFRQFIEDLTGEGSKKKAPLINRGFYENLISRIILFRNLEKLYGSGKDKIGNLRAAVIPYSISILFSYTDGSQDEKIFDFDKIWLKEKLDKDLADYLYTLMTLMNDLLKKYSTSDDINENSKRKELWESILSSNEIKAFSASGDSEKIINKYCISKEEHKKRLLKIAKTVEVNFKLIEDNVSIHSNGVSFYKKLLSKFQKFTNSDKEKLEDIIRSVFKHEDLDQKHIDYERNLINKVMIGNPEIFDQIEIPKNYHYDTLDRIIELYNDAINNQEDVRKVFEKESVNAKLKKLKDYTIWRDIGEDLTKGNAPNISSIISGSSIFTQIAEPERDEKYLINEATLIKMIEWDASKKILTNNERNYLSEFAYGFKKINPYHENNIRRHLQTLIKNGYTI